jgi:hypothetical protein
MGEAKRRGTFEQRATEAAARRGQAGTTPAPAPTECAPPRAPARAYPLAVALLWANARTLRPRWNA